MRIKRARKKRRTSFISPVMIAAVIFLAACFASVFLQPDPPEEEPSLTELLEAGRDPQVEAILGEMTPEQKVGQMFMGCFYTGTPSPETVEKYHLGGVLLFGASFKKTSPEVLTSRLQSIEAGPSISPIIAVDEEGGSVVRASAYKSYRKEPFQSPRALYEKGGLEAVLSDVHEKNMFLLELGIHMNLAPVCDISQDPDDFMYHRSLGQDADVTSAFAASVVRICREDGIACSLKHFPGYGSSADTHKGLAADPRSLKDLAQRDLLPFQAGIRAGAPSVMVSHNIVSSIDHALPASLSPAVHRLLRENMDFRGVIITDDLSMGAITDFLPQGESAVTAVLAGNDLLCTGDYKNQYEAVLEALDNGVISEERVNESVRRILQMKKTLGILS